MDALFFFVFFLVVLFLIILLMFGYSPISVTCRLTVGLNGKSFIGGG